MGSETCRTCTTLASTLPHCRRPSGDEKCCCLISSYGIYLVTVPHNSNLLHLQTALRLFQKSLLRERLWEALFLFSVTHIKMFHVIRTANQFPFAAGGIGVTRRILLPLTSSSLPTHRTFTRLSLLASKHAPKIRTAGFRPSTRSLLRPVLVSILALRAASTQFSTSACYRSISKEDRKKTEAGIPRQQQESSNGKGRKGKDNNMSKKDFGIISAIAAVIVVVGVWLAPRLFFHKQAEANVQGNPNVAGLKMHEGQMLVDFYTNFDWAVCGMCNLVIPIVKLLRDGQCHKCGCKTMRKAGIILEHAAEVGKNEDGEMELKTHGGPAIATLAVARKPHGMVC